MHAAAYNFVQKAVEGVTMRGKRVVEFGSFNVNGSVRPLFEGAADYIGIDSRVGPDVDVVQPAESFEGDEKFHIVVSCETLEHAGDPEAVIAAAWRALRPGGMLILTAAGEGRQPHGIDGGAAGAEHYQNITRDDLRAWLKGWSDVHISVNAEAKDIYATAVKPEAEKPTAKAATKQTASKE